MAIRKISLVWEGDLDDDSLEFFMASPADCVEFLDDCSDAKIIIEENDKVIFDSGTSEEEIEGLEDEKEPEDGE